MHLWTSATIRPLMPSPLALSAPSPHPTPHKRLLAYFMSLGPQGNLAMSMDLFLRVAPLTLAATVVESLPLSVNDNLTVPGTAALASCLLFPVPAAYGSTGAAAVAATLAARAPGTLRRLAARAIAPCPGVLVGATVNCAVFAAGARVLNMGLSQEAICHAWVLGTVVFSVFGAGGYALVCAFFILGTLVSGSLRS